MRSRRRTLTAVTSMDGSVFESVTMWNTRTEGSGEEKTVELTTAATPRRLSEMMEKWRREGSMRRAVCNEVQ